ncbi:MAG: hypothetical protein V2I33_25770 [Kangiellaceae bacterium]|jgi:hypothetical protein|nr:hypothetical protein [Kangiellaceae bacterium]
MTKDEFLVSFGFIGSSRDVRTEIEGVKLQTAKFSAAFDAFQMSLK